MMVRVDWARIVGRNIHRLRGSAGLSLAELAEAGGISKTTLHGIEQGAGNPTLSTLWALATALQVPLGELLEQHGAPAEVTRAGQGPRVDGDAVHARLLHRIRLRGTVEVYDIELDEAHQHSAAHAPGVRECLVLTEGTALAGPEESAAELAAGDSIRFDADTPHVYAGRGERNRAVLLMLHEDAGG